MMFESVMFPAGAGMNLQGRQPYTARGNVPRRRGDEPLIFDAGSLRLQCSPQARG